MTGDQMLIVGILLFVGYLIMRTIYRRLTLNREERAFLRLATEQGMNRDDTMRFVNLARAKGTKAIDEVSVEARALDENDLIAARRNAAIAVMERAARDERRRLLEEGKLNNIEEINEAADAAGTAVLNRYVEPGGPLAEDSPMSVQALNSLIEQCNVDLEGLPERERYVTSVGRVAMGMDP